LFFLVSYKISSIVHLSCFYSLAVKGDDATFTGASKHTSSCTANKIICKIPGIIINLTANLYCVNHPLPVAF